MKRVLIIGSCGAGKSTLARRLHKITGLKLIHLDKHYHLPNWTEPNEDDWNKKVEELISDDDGLSMEIMAVQWVCVLSDAIR